MSAVSYLETGVIYCDDNLHRLSEFPAECVDLIYLDPPFFSNRHYEVIWGDEAEVRSFEDRWEGGIQVYIQWMRERIIELRRVLKPSGSIYLHCDWHASHYLKVMMDEVFGDSNFRNEIVWCYWGPGSRQRQFSRKHDILFWYSVGETWTFNADAVRIAHSEKTKENYKPGLRGSGFESDERLLHAKGKIPEDWWQFAIAPRGKEYLGYPTQKPRKLLERVILASSNKGDVVLDPFCGCGTTLVVAELNRRKWIGIDISPTAVELMKRRIRKVSRAEVKLVGMPVTEEQLHALKPFEFQNWVIQRFNGTHSPRKSGDMGIDGYSFLEHLPIQVKQSEHVGRNVVDNFETALERSGKTKGYIAAFSFTRDAYEEVARVRASKGVEVVLVKVADLVAETTELVTPSTGELFAAEDLLVIPRPGESRPSVEQLIDSDRGTNPPHSN